MILNSAPQNEAVMSNVGQIGEFRIRNSAKAFSILSSGLYANKIRAIIRELSCNAVDSHTAAGTGAMPFDVHLPTVLEPYFSIRDYGTGLTHDQVTSIYTTYFESTKTNSNAFIGALGLGSKSPFSYTDNFTVTAIKGKRKGIYTAFINDEGVPSIALMAEEDTNEAPGVEVKFSVNERYDFDKFKQEARSVYKYFKLRPNISGPTSFEFENPDYETKDIIPGVHSLPGNVSWAIMGNIAYKIEIPASDKTLGELSNLLKCGLVIEFNIGELDFQASREGLSYIPLTLESIKNKLEVLNAKLAETIATEADKIENLWDRAALLRTKIPVRLWTSAVAKYIRDTNFPLITIDSKYGDSHHSFRNFRFQHSVKDLQDKFNIQIRGFDKNRSNASCTNIKPGSNRTYNPTTSTYDYIPGWEFEVEPSLFFVLKDTNIGGLERAKHHWRTAVKPVSYTDTVLLIEPADSLKPMDTVGFFNSIANPSKVLKLSNLTLRPRDVEGRAKNVSILKLEKKSAGYSHYHKSDGNEMVWRDAGDTGKLPDKDPITGITKNYYYVELTGFLVKDMAGYSTAKALYDDMQNCGISKLKDFTIYGVRKTDIEDIKKLKNWIPVKKLITDILTKIDEKTAMSLVKKSIDSSVFSKYNNEVCSMLDSKSPFVVMNTRFKDVSGIRYQEWSLNSLIKMVGGTLDIKELINKTQQEIKILVSRYPLLGLSGASLHTYEGSAAAALAEYINLIDEKKGI